VSERQAALTEAVQQFTPGQVVRGQVLRLEDYGALISLYNSQVGHTMAAHTQSTHLSH
jgi:ribosomal protein S1